MSYHMHVGMSELDQKKAVRIARYIEIAAGLIAYARQDPFRWAKECVWVDGPGEDDITLIALTIPGKRVTVSVRSSEPWRSLQPGPSEDSSPSSQSG